MRFWEEVLVDLLLLRETFFIPFFLVSFLFFFFQIYIFYKLSTWQFLIGWKEGIFAYLFHSTITLEQTTLLKIFDIRRQAGTEEGVESDLSQRE